MSHKNKVGYITPHATFEIDGPVIVAKIDGRYVDHVRADFTENEHLGYNIPGKPTWQDAMNDGRLDVNGYGFITAHVA